MADQLKEKEVSLKDIKYIQKILKKLSNEWAAKLSEKMSKSDPCYNVTKIYNIVNGVIKHQEHKINFVYAAKELIEELKAEKEKAALVVREIKESNSTK